MNKAADLAIGGWQVTGITTFQTGFPFSSLANDKFGLLTTFTQRSNLVAGCNPNSGFHKSINEYFNTACFVQPLAGQFGNSGRDILRGPGINNWDMGFGKTSNSRRKLPSSSAPRRSTYSITPSTDLDPTTSTRNRRPGGSTQMTLPMARSPRPGQAALFNWEARSLSNQNPVA